MKDLNDLLQAGVSLDTVLEASARMTPLEAEETDQALAASGIQLLTEFATSVPQGKDDAQARIGWLISDHATQLGYAWRLRATETEGLLFKAKASMPHGAKGDVATLVQAIKREAKRQQRELKGRFVSSGKDGADPGVWDALTKTEEGTPLQSFDNACIVLEKDPRHRNRLSHCEFSARSLRDGEPLTDEDTLSTRRWLEQAYGLRLSSIMVHEAIELVARGTKVHPIREYLSGLAWDGVPRLDSMFPALFGVEDTTIAHAYGRKFMISAVARVMDPGCKVDTMPILVGGQGAKKSTGFEVLAGRWFRDAPIEMGSKDGSAVLAGSWIHEMPELESLRRGKEATTVKAYLSMKVDVYRPSYGRHVIEQPRQCVFVGTSNPGKFLKDPTGSRRFWVMQVEGRVNVDRIAQLRDQLWAEALHRFNQGEEWWLTDQEEERRRKANDRWQEPDVWSEQLHAWLDEFEATLAANTEARVRMQQMASEALGISAERVQGKPSSAAIEVLTDRGYRRAYRKDKGSNRGTYYYVRMLAE